MEVKESMKHLKRKLKLRFVQLKLSLLLPASIVMCTMAVTVPVYATDVSAITRPFDVISALVFAAVKCIGLVIGALGGADLGSGISGHDSGQQKQGGLKLAGGVFLFFIKDILSLMGMS